MNNLLIEKKHKTFINGDVYSLLTRGEANEKSINKK